MKRGRTLQVGYLSQTVAELRGSERVLESVEQIRRETRLATGREAGAASLLEDFGFTGERLTTRLGRTSPAANGDGCSSSGCCSPSRTCCCWTSRPTTWTSTR